MMANYFIYNGNLYNADEIKHWKYVSKKKVNGKWRYYYKDDEYENAVRENEAAKKALDKAAATVKDADRNERTYRNEMFDDSEITTEEEQKHAQLASKLSEAKRAHVEAGKKYVTTNKKLEQVTAKTSVRRAIAKGVASVLNFFSSLFGK